MKKTTAARQGDNHCEQVCPIVYAMDIIGRKWSIPSLWNVAEHKTLHYNELRRLIAPITNTVLTRCLRELENSGMVCRLNHNTIPPSVEYSLTDKGKSLMPALMELYHWGKAQQE